MAVSKHVAVLAFPFTSHAATLLSLIRRISEAVPDVAFFFFSTSQSNDYLFSKSEEHGKIRPYSVSNGLPEGYVFNGDWHEPKNYFVKALPGNFKGAMDKVVEETGKGFDCLVTDAFYWFGADIAEELQVPWLPFWVAGHRFLFLFLEIDKIRRYIKSSKEKTLDLFSEFSAIRGSDLPTVITSENMDAPVPVMLNKMRLKLPRATAILGDSYEELDSTIVNMVRSRLQKYLSVGPIFLTCQSPSFADPHGCLEWLNKHQTASVVYIGFGTVLKPPPHELVALAEAMEEMGLPYLWSLKGEPEQELPRAFVERTREQGKIVPWTPQRQVLEHPSVGVHVTHGGWKSVMESMLGGVPLICRPFFADNQLNSRTVEAVWGIGLTVGGGVFTKEGTLKALNSILFDEEGKKMRKKIKIHKELVRKTVEPNSSSTQNFNTLVKIIREH